ncbi:MAG TPA: hypothetical protein VE714_10045, partial [Gemmatimonadales bacterium]|nr:hypothetical protein [Gemmatimonadales bacterium]
MSTRCAFVLLLWTAAAAQAQTFAGGERENYLRYLQTVRLVPLYPWGARAFSVRELDELAPNTAAGGGEGRRRSDDRLVWLPLGTSVRFNSTFPYGYNDGPIWAGRGVTLALEGGFVVRRGALSLTIAPLAFVAQNTRFPLMGNTFADGSVGDIIDRPQRFGNGAYARLDPGQSTLRVDWRA